MKRNMILMFQNSQDDMNVQNLPALLTLNDEHANALLWEIYTKHPYPKATTVSLALSHESCTEKPEFLLLDKKLENEFPGPDHITAIADVDDKSFTVKLTYEYCDQGIWSSENFFSNPISVQHLYEELSAEMEMAEWLTNDCDDIAYVKKTLGQTLFADMLSKMHIEEADLQEALEKE